MPIVQFSHALISLDERPAIIVMHVVCLTDAASAEYKWYNFFIRGPSYVHIRAIRSGPIR